MAGQCLMHPGGLQRMHGLTDRGCAAGHGGNEPLTLVVTAEETVQLRLVTRFANERQQVALLGLALPFISNRKSAPVDSGKMEPIMSSPLFSKYLSKTGDIPLLTREREAELGRIVQTGLRPEATENQKRACEDAQHELVQKNLKLVVGTAKRFLRGALTLEEMTSDGNQGLTEAAKRYNPAFKTRFSTYATWWIRQAIQEVYTGRR